MPKPRPPVRHQVTNASGELIGSWSVEGGMLCVRARNGAVRRTQPSKSNEAVARQLLAEAWAKS